MHNPSAAVIYPRNLEGHTIMDQCTIDEIQRTSNLLPFEAKHTQFLLSVLKKQHSKGLVVRFHPEFTQSAQAALDGMDKGVFVLTCPQIESDFVFTCENAGQGLFGRQKRVFKVYDGDFALDEFSAASTFKSFALAATSINNIFRHVGLLSGPL
ncbi:hypothetical protein [Octadecabacter temperatus]|nr:hypothetical protein [Octadecabacter temperatus]